MVEARRHRARGRGTIGAMTWFFAVVVVARDGRRRGRRRPARRLDGRGLRRPPGRPGAGRRAADRPTTCAGSGSRRRFRGYRMSEVDALLDRLAAELERAATARPVTRGDGRRRRRARALPLGDCRRRTTSPTTTRSGGGRSAATGALFERLTLEAFQSGLSWITILRKREAFRAAFAGFDPARGRGVRRRRRRRLLADAGIVRNRAKIDAAIANAPRVAATLDGGLDRPALVVRAGRRRPAPADAGRRPGGHPGVDGAGQGAEAARLPLRRPHHGVRPDAGDRHGRRPPRRLLGPRQR